MPSHFQETRLLNSQLEDSRKNGSLLVGRLKHELLSNALGDAFTGVFFGIALYMVNYYVISPMAGWPWFREGGNVVVQFLSHGLFGFVAGWMVAGARSEATGMSR